MLSSGNLPSEGTLNNTHSGNNTGANAGSLPAELAALVEAPGLVAQDGAQADDGGEVGGDDALALAVGQGGDLGAQPVVGAASLALSGLLLLPSPVAGGGGVPLRLHARRLRLGLDVLLQEVRGHGADGPAVDVDQGAGRGGGGLVGDDLGRLGRGALDERRPIVSLRSHRAGMKCVEGGVCDSGEGIQ